MDGSHSNYSSNSSRQLIGPSSQFWPTANLDNTSRSEIENKVNLWLDTQNTHIRFDGMGPMRPHRQMPVLMPLPIDDQNLLPAPKGDQKKVRWTPSVKDNEKAPKKYEEKTKNSTAKGRLPSSPKSWPAPPPAPNPPRSRGPPPSPRPRRLSTPDLPHLKHVEDIAFCPCCDAFPSHKMCAQIAAAKRHIASKASGHQLVASSCELATCRYLSTSNQHDSRMKIVEMTERPLKLNK